MKLQDAFVAESAAMGDFSKIGYAMKSSETFTYDEAGFTPANANTTMVETIGTSTFKDGWRATSGVKLNDCGAKSTWVVGLKATSGSAEGMVEYRTAISSQVCADLTPSFEKLTTNAANKVIGSST